MKILKSEFIKGIIGNDYILKDNLPQIAFFGRSNAGKSSVINSLVNKKKLVKISKNPGETTEANFFLINDSFYFVDFPGYGYAKCPIKFRNKMIKRIFWYLENSSVKPKVIFLIIDFKVGLTPLDYEMIEKIKKNNHQIIIIANKIDKVKKSQKEKQLSLIKENALGIPILLYSSKTKEGQEEFLEKINIFI